MDISESKLLKNRTYYSPRPDRIDLHSEHAPKTSTTSPSVGTVFLDAGATAIRPDPATLGRSAG